ncbi:hypothetical protein CDD82_2610 [Ophiocordyceps australis]|uniref:Uncharacterized protein n=1 Tax=Ophiocordyceps australis TaxID=1399860 RepID=A0A2C5ZGT7_9HYPO|nr:hypothetical protein CDD82_2610 [Ophiocordyceps australis]
MYLSVLVGFLWRLAVTLGQEDGFLDRRSLQGQFEGCRTRGGWAAVPSTLMSDLHLEVMSFQRRPGWYAPESLDCVRIDWEYLEECNGQQTICAKDFVVRQFKGDNTKVPLAKCVDLREPTRRSGLARRFYCYDPHHTTGVYTLCGTLIERTLSNCEGHFPSDYSLIGSGAAARGNVDITRPQSDQGAEDQGDNETEMQNEAQDEVQNETDDTVDKAESSNAEDQDEISNMENNEPARVNSARRLGPLCGLRMGWHVDLNSLKRDVFTDRTSMVKGPDWYKPLVMDCMRLSRREIDSCMLRPVDCARSNVEMNFELNIGQTLQVPLAQCVDLIEPLPDDAVPGNWYCFDIGGGDGLFSICDSVDISPRGCHSRYVVQAKLGPRLTAGSGPPGSEHTHLTIAGAAADFAGPTGGPGTVRLRSSSREDWRDWKPYSNADEIQVAAAGDYYVKGKNGVRHRGFACVGLDRQTYLVADTQGAERGCRSAGESVNPMGDIDVRPGWPTPCDRISDANMAAIPARVICTRAWTHSIDLYACQGIFNRVAFGCSLLMDKNAGKLDWPL